jgi:hypothetical protein
MDIAQQLVAINAKLAQLGVVVVNLHEQGGTIMATIQELHAAVNALTTTAASATDMLHKITAEHDPAAMQVMVDVVNKVNTDLQTAVGVAGQIVHTT